MNFTLAFSSLGFVGRFIIAFVILAYLHYKDKDDIHITNGFRWLCILGAIIFVLLVVLFFLVFVVGGIGITHSIMNNFHNFYF